MASMLVLVTLNVTASLLANAARFMKIKTLIEACSVERCYIRPTKRTSSRIHFVSRDVYYVSAEGFIGRANLARGNEAGGSWGQHVHILHVNI